MMLCVASRERSKQLSNQTSANWICLIVGVSNIVWIFLSLFLFVQQQWLSVQYTFFFYTLLFLRIFSHLNDNLIWSTAEDTGTHSIYAWC